MERLGIRGDASNQKIGAKDELIALLRTGAPDVQRAMDLAEAGGITADELLAAMAFGPQAGLRFSADCKASEQDRLRQVIVLAAGRANGPR